MNKTIIFLTIICTLFITSCKKDENIPTISAGEASVNTSSSLSVLLLWNDAGTVAVARTGTSSPTGPLPPMAESRIYAILNLAVHDALNGIYPKYKSYALTTPAEINASAEAAISYAAHDVMVALLPKQLAYADSLLKAVLLVIPEGTAKQNGMSTGKAAAGAILAKRTSDGAATAQFPYTQGTLPGQYRSTPPFNSTGFVALPGWGSVTPFGLSSAAQFRVAPPYAINSAEYTTDFNEVKSLGSKTSATRTADQTQIGLFWLNSAPLSFNRIARALVVKKSLGTLQAARLLALVAMAEADANIACFDSKFYYNFWRPITAIALADADGNDNTSGDATWNVLAPPTPPVPDHPSNHATDGGAGAEVLKMFFGEDAISFSITSSSLPGVTRSFTSFSQAATENSLSRIYVGYHFRNAVMMGEDLGRKIGEYIIKNNLQEK
jgi:PAP2 superfamily